MTRTISRPAISFEQWAAANGIKLPSDAIEAEVIGMAFIPPSMLTWLRLAHATRPPSKVVRSPP